MNSTAPALRTGPTAAFVPQRGRQASGLGHVHVGAEETSSQIERRKVLIFLASDGAVWDFRSAGRAGIPRATS
jgi:hypothetical protein